ncbi:hypothetical protein BYT27DRAFT_7213240 [Phlegmacium glaucopus]|nr:hypothetical protein BYT27DRAFT_7213240 [Phlegmacium glaucopus]
MFSNPFVVDDRPPKALLVLKKELIDARLQKASRKSWVWRVMAELQGLEPAVSEANVTKNYLDWLTQIYLILRFAFRFLAVVIRLKTIPSLLLKRYSTKINYGLTDVKSRILEFLVGPPSVGKALMGKAMDVLIRFFYSKDVPVDLSRLLFVCAATLTLIPAPLLDRMEVLEVSGYVSEAKSLIISRYLGPQVKEASGLAEANVELESSTVDIYRKTALKLVQDLGEDAFPEPKQPGASTLAQAQTFPPT